MVILWIFFQEHPLDKRVQTAIKDIVDISFFDMGPMVLNHLIGVKHIRPDLAAPGDIVFAVVELLAFFILFQFLLLVQPGH
jgi:hypothetical protein